jgi:hypothetical protein
MSKLLHAITMALVPHLRRWRPERRHYVRRRVRADEVIA